MPNGEYLSTDPSAGLPQNQKYLSTDPDAGKPPIAPQPLRAQMLREGTIASTRDPQEAYLKDHPEARERVEAGSSMAIPEGLLSIAAMGPTSLVKSGLRNAVKAVAVPLAKGYVGSKLGGSIGSDIGGRFGEPEVGRIIGEVGGGLYGGLGGKFPTLKTLLGTGEEEAPVIGRRFPTGPKVSAPESIPVEEMPARVKPLSNAQIGRNVESGVREAAGTPELRPGIPLRNQVMGTVGAKTVTEEPNIELTGPKIQTPSRSETMTENLKNRVPGSNPLESKLPLREQPISPERTPAEPKEETVHPMTRQSIHVNGAQATELTEGKPGLRNDLLDLEGEQLREVLRKSGENMENIQTVGRSAGKSGGVGGGKIVDPKNISRSEAFDILFEKGYTPEQIVKEAPPRSKPAPLRKAFGPPLKNPLASRESGL